MNIDEIIKVTTEIQSTCYLAKKCSECAFSQLKSINLKGNITSTISSYICPFDWTPMRWKINILTAKVSEQKGEEDD